MGKFKLKRALGESGLSLVEVLASFVILTLLLTTFLMMFIQSAKVNKASEHIIDATYIAQTEMESIYALSLNTKYGERKEGIESLPFKNSITYMEIGNENGWNVFERNYNSVISIKIKLQNKKGTMDRVLIEVREMPKGTLRAQMENVLIWGAD